MQCVKKKRREEKKEKKKRKTSDSSERRRLHRALAVVADESRAMCCAQCAYVWMRARRNYLIRTFFMVLRSALSLSLHRPCALLCEHLITSRTLTLSRSLATLNWRLRIELWVSSYVTPSSSSFFLIFLSHEYWKIHFEFIYYIIFAIQIDTQNPTNESMTHRTRFHLCIYIHIIWIVLLNLIKMNK